MELEIYSTLLRPADVSHISDDSVHCNGITRDDASEGMSTRSFSEILEEEFMIRIGVDMVAESHWFHQKALKDLEQLTLKTQ